MDIKDDIPSIQDKIEKTNKKLVELEEQIKKSKNDIIPNLVVNIKKSLMENASNFYITSNYEIIEPKVKILKEELKNTIEDIGNNLVEELNNINIWNFNNGKDKFELYNYQDQTDLSKNKKLWLVIRKSPEKIDNLFNNYNFPIERQNYSYSGEYHSPYGFNFYGMNSIFGYGFEKNTSLDIVNMIRIYWENIGKYFELIKSLEILNEELRKFKRRQDWGN